jgi:hypothetical protein
MLCYSKFQFSKILFKKNIRKCNYLTRMWANDTLYLSTGSMFVRIFDYWQEV